MRVRTLSRRSAASSLPRPKKQNALAFFSWGEGRGEGRPANTSSFPKLAARLGHLRMPAPRRWPRRPTFPHEFGHLRRFLRDVGFVYLRSLSPQHRLTRIPGIWLGAVTPNSVVPLSSFCRPFFCHPKQREQFGRSGAVSPRTKGKNMAGTKNEDRFSNRVRLWFSLDGRHAPLFLLNSRKPRKQSKRK